MPKEKKLAPWEIKWQKALSQIPEWAWTDNPYICHCHAKKSKFKCNLPCQKHPI